MPQRGNGDYDQMRLSARQGNGPQFQMFGRATTLNGAISSGATSLVVSANFPSMPSTPFTIAFDDGSGEQARVTAVTGTTWTVTRGYNSTTAAAHASRVVLHAIPGSGNTLI